MTKKIPKNRQNEQYWLNREKQQQAYIDKNLASDEQYNKVIQAQYDSLLADINKRIDSELSKLANENGISIADMRAKVSQTDIKQFEAEAKRVVAQADKMRKQGKSPKFADWSQEVNDRLRLYNATMRINRLEYLKAGIGLDMITAGLQVDSELRDKLFKDATEEQKRQAGILGENNAHIDTLAIGNIILAKTKSNNFSQRIWTNMDVLQAKLSQTIMAGITTGQSYDEMARRLKTQVSKDVQNVTYATQRIARTEATRVQTEITMNSLKRNGYDFCKWYKEPSACHDCALIGNQDNGWGKGIYKVKDVPTIPVHPNCRCAVGAYWVDEKNNLYETPNYNEQSEELGRIKKVQENNTAKLNRLFNSLNIKTAKADDIIELGNAFNKEYNIQDNLGNKSYISNALSKYRDVGEDIPEKSWAKGSNRQIKNDLKQAFSHYPKEWSEYLDNEYMLAGKAEDRGFYVRWYATQKGNTKMPTWLVKGNRLREGVTMDQYKKFGEDLHNGKYNSIYSTGKRETTAWHEIGHFVEEHNKDTLRISKEFVANRTKGEQPEMLRDILKAPDYDESEVTLKDNFISPYIGKVYDDATEVLSMGLESIFEPVKMGQLKYVDNNGQAHRARIEDDEEYLNLILGILLKG